jgi:chemotaxis receptor (MCP) glutamine deamidase CheD
MNSPAKQSKRKRIQIKRGEICVSCGDILYAHISTCVSLCLFDPGTGIGGMTHISRCRSDDTTPSGKYLVNHGYYYADTAVEGLLKRFRKEHPHINEKSIESLLIGGIDSEGPVAETIEVLKRYRFRERGADINNKLHRYIEFDTAAGIVVISRNKPYSERREKVVVSFNC